MASALPDDLPRPVDDGAADHLRGAALPPLALPATDGRSVRLDRPGELPRTVVYAYPRIGAPLVADWDRIPGARGCTAESCAFRDHAADIRAGGADVYGLSTQSLEQQRDAVTRLSLPFPLLSDPEGKAARGLSLPTFEVCRHRLLKRLTLIVRARRIEHVFYPVFPPDRHADEVLAWLRAHPA